MHECWGQRITLGSLFFSSTMCILGVELKLKLRLKGKRFYPLSHLARPKSFSYYNFYEFFLETFMPIYNSFCLLSSAPFFYFSPPDQANSLLDTHVSLFCLWPTDVDRAIFVTVGCFVCFTFFFFFLKKMRSWNSSVDQAGFVLTEVRLCLPPKCWDARCAPLHLAAMSLELLISVYGTSDI